MVKWLRHRPFTAVTRVRSPVGSPLEIPVLAIGTGIFIEISEEEKGMFFLFDYDENGKMLGDTCHFSLGEAKAQALFSYGVEDSDWIT